VNLYVSSILVSYGGTVHQYIFARYDFFTLNIDFYA
jgi:hypothetical protein